MAAQPLKELVQHAELRYLESVRARADPLRYVKGDGSLIRLVAIVEED